jgi:hypothetical protein
VPLSIKQKELIAYVDSKVKSIKKNGGDEVALLIGLTDQMPELRAIINYPDKDELQIYIDKYDGFYSYIKLLESLALGIKDGSIKVP